jgi:hypothetical protein
MAKQSVVIRGERSWVLESREVELAVTERGGQMAPVFFFRDTRTPVQPYYVSPWQGRGVATGVPVLDPLRGDFFCMPFGGGETWKGEAHPAHGESAGSRWELVGQERGGGASVLTLGLTTKVRPGRITKTITLVDGQNVLYIRHHVEGCEGRMCVSHHATLAVPEEPGSLRLSTSPLRFGRVVPRANLANTGNEYYFLEPGARFSRLDSVPTIWKSSPRVDLSSHPVPRGFMDLVAVFPRQVAAPAWTAVVMPRRGCLWFALRDASLLPQTVFWMSNGGRHAAPWSGVNRCLGVEDGCAYFTLGLTASARKNDLNAEGVRTTLTLRSDRPTRIAHIQGMARVPAGFDRVRAARFEPGAVTFTSWSGKQARAEVRWDFLSTGEVSPARPRR